MSDIIKWGAPKPIPVMDSKYNIRIGAVGYGTCSYEIVDKKRFGSEVASPDTDLAVQNITIDTFIEYITKEFTTTSKIPSMPQTKFIDAANAAAAEKGFKYTSLDIIRISIDAPSKEKIRELDEQRLHESVIPFPVGANTDTNTNEVPAPEDDVKNEDKEQASGTKFEAFKGLFSSIFSKK